MCEGPNFVLERSIKCVWNLTCIFFCPTSSQPSTSCGIQMYPASAMNERWPATTNTTQSRACLCVCVCLICKDVKLRFWFFTSYAGGCRECHSSAANEDGYDILWYRSGTLDRRTCQFSGMGRGSTLEPPCRFVSISLQRTKLHQNPPQSKDVESTLGTICLHDRRQHRRRQLFIG